MSLVLATIKSIVRQYYVIIIFCGNRWQTNHLVIQLVSISDAIEVMRFNTCFQQYFNCNNNNNNNL